MLEMEQSALKDKVAVILEKSQNDDRLIAALRGEVSSLRRGGAGGGQQQASPKCGRGGDQASGRCGQRSGGGTEEMIPSLLFCLPAHEIPSYLA